MPDLELLAQTLGLIVVTAPVVLVVLLGLSSLVERHVGEPMITKLVQTAISMGLLSAFGVLAIMLITGQRNVPIELGNWVEVHHYHFALKFEFDRLSVPFVILTFILCGTIGAFAARYMHREKGFNRFFTLYALFLLGMAVTSLAGTIETLFAGWELVGLSSALLVAFFHERTAPVQNGLRVWVVYRISDAALLIAAVFLHHLTGEGDFDKLMGMGGPWPMSKSDISRESAFAVGLLLLLAAAGKSALVPFSGWLPRAMEGPTPSSAVFYGALSVHLGAFLLLRVSPVLELSPPLCAMIVVIGLTTACLATFTGRTQTDIKSALSFASLTQVGLIVAEVGLGCRYIALAHIMGHGCLRTLQFVRAPTLLHDYHTMENAIGTSLPNWSSAWVQRIPDGIRRWFYRLALERGYLDACLDGFIVRPFLRFFELCGRWEQRWIAFLSGTAANHSPSNANELGNGNGPEALEDLL